MDAILKFIIDAFPAIMIIAFFFGFTIFTIFWLRCGPTVVGGNNIFFPKKKKVLPTSVPSTSELVCRDDYLHVFWLSVTYRLVPDGRGILGVYLLKWLFSGQISVVPNSTDFDFTKLLASENSLENVLYNYFLVTTNDGIVHLEDVKKWFYSNYIIVEKTIDDFLDTETTKLKQEGKVVDKKILSNSFQIVSDDLYREASELRGLRMFFKSAEKTNSQDQFTSGLFRYYIIYGQLLGVEDEVISLLKKFHPEYLDSANYTYDDILNVISLENCVYEEILSAKRWASNTMND